MPDNSPDRKKPNIVLVNCDDMGYGDPGCYGSEVNKTPALDQLAAEGVRFTDFYMASPVCSPSRGAMMTGCYPARIGFGSFDGAGVLFPGHGVGLNPSEITIARLLKDAGYATKHIGKWHCGDQPEFLPTNHGFDSYYGIPFSNDMGRQLRRSTKPADDGSGTTTELTISKNPPLPLLRDEDVIQEQPDQAALTERYVEESVRFIRENQSRPFFLYLAHMYVHVPIYAPDKFMRQSQNGRYGAGVECVDWAMDVIMHELRRLGIDENTLVIFTSDNGSRARNEGGSNAPLRGTKGTTWEGGQRVPCIMRWPAAIQAWQVNNEIVTSMDFYPTLANIGGAEIPTDRIIDGKNILPLMKGDEGAFSPRDAFFYYWKNTIEAVRSGKWKLHIRKKDKEIKELYDLESDIGETTNVYDQHPDVVAELRKKTEVCRKDIGDETAGIEGENIRPIGRVDHPKPLTEYDPDHPYIIALYDLPDAG